MVNKGIKINVIPGLLVKGDRHTKGRAWAKIPEIHKTIAQKDPYGY